MPHDLPPGARSDPALPRAREVGLAPAAPTELVLQRILLDRPVGLRALYWTLREDVAAEPPAGGSVHVPPGGLLGFDTYFGVFQEQSWRLHTELGELFLRLDLRGACTLRVTRRTAHTRQVVVEQPLDGDGPVLVPIPAERVNFRQHGLLAFQILARDAVEFRGGAWVTRSAARPAGLAALFCTFNRETDIAAVLEAISGDDAVISSLARVHVVNQGRPGLAAHPAIAPLLARHPGRIRITEQANFGGAGGFGRGLLEALDDPACTHAVMLDDDIRIEPDSLLRLASFFTLARGEFPVGGQMLDMVQPTRVYEAGAIIRPENWSFFPQHHLLDAADPENLISMIGPDPVHYGGWWCLGLPLSLIRREGMPLPCFLRGDDVELGLRHSFAGIHTVIMPGIAVWHEPFYLRLGGWQLYYETRNMLIAAALHMDPGGRGMALRMMHHLLFHLLMFRYYSSALIIRAILDFLHGPAILETSPLPLHGEIGAIHGRYPAETVPRGVVLAEQETRREPRTGPGWFLRRLSHLADNALRPSRPGAAPRRLPAKLFHWGALGRGADAIAVETWWDRELPVFRRSRREYFATLREGVPALWRLYREGPIAGAAWRAAFPRHRSIAFWRSYLGLAKGGAMGGERG
ncbi:glycosyltransferase [Roseomonas sp. SSH11]|uniref:Glycosyltransferase n=1 Tax=Pararoseomonas baculiformis TaxID=2820812 RepID=A0ABS4A8C6_9PROT|nr:glycosyltransferase [Pararoseomonas baculiformis]MBP0443249.1 glycosyltransferase [Pararoseomonas baculiformis]